MDRNEIINKKFPHAFFGYDVSEVDVFLDEVIREMDRLNNEMDVTALRAEASRQREDALKARIEMLEQKLIDTNIPFEDTVDVEIEPVQLADAQLVQPEQMPADEIAEAALDIEDDAETLAEAEAFLQEQAEYNDAESK